MLASKKYVDLIYEASDQCANWTPAVPIATVGDYGTLNDKTGRFEPQGNIFIDFPKASFAQLPVFSAPLNHKTITSKNTVAISVEPSVDLGVPQAEVVFSGGWSWSRHSGAVLITRQPAVRFLHPRTNVAQLFSETKLKDMYVVREVVVCRSYALYLARGGDSKISLALRAKSPIGPAPVTVGAGLEAGWIQKWTNGVYECGISDHPKKRPFTVLLTLLQSPAQSFFDWLFSPRNPTPPQTKEGIPFGSGTAVEHKSNTVPLRKKAYWELADAETSGDIDDDSDGQHGDDEFNGETDSTLRNATLAQLLSFEAGKARPELDPAVEEEDWEDPDTFGLGRKSLSDSDPVVFYDHAKNATPSWRDGDRSTNEFQEPAHDTLRRELPEAAPPLSDNESENESGLLVFNHEELKILEPWLRNQGWDGQTRRIPLLDQLLKQIDSPLGRLQGRPDFSHLLATSEHGRDLIKALRAGKERPEFLGKGPEMFGLGRAQDDLE